MGERNRYSAILESIFRSKYRPGAQGVDFQRSDIEKFAKRLKISLPKNLGDLIYSFRFRAAMPRAIQARAGKGRIWVIRLVGRGKYRLELIRDFPLIPNEHMAVTKVPDATPGVIVKYALGDEQALLARVRYNRLVDIFSGVACYSLQNHLRTTAEGMGQVETDELYVGVDKKGMHYVFPVQAKGGSDRLSIVQIEQDIAVCHEKFPSLICRPIGTQFMKDDEIVLFEFERAKDGVQIVCEKHYKLVPPEDVTEKDLESYRRRAEG